jgi:hypothetical protein
MIGHLRRASRIIHARLSGRRRRLRRVYHKNSNAWTKGCGENILKAYKRESTEFSKVRYASVRSVLQTNLVNPAVITRMRDLR